MTQNKFVKFIKDENAQAMAEYALLALIFCLACYGALELMKRAWANKWTNTVNARASNISIGSPKDFMGGNPASLRGIGP